MFLLALLAPFLTLQSARLFFEAPPELESVRARLQAMDPRGLADITDLTGVTGPPVRVVLTPEGTDLARQVPDWIVGFAQSDLIVIFPARTPTYPHGTLEDVLRHELAHVLIRRAARGGDIPRWFNEGLAMTAERGWRLEDRTRLLSLLSTGLRTDVDDLERLFAGGHAGQSRAYTVAGALVRDLVQQFGEEAPKQILRHVGAGQSFEAAFADVTGVTPLEAQNQFWSRRGFWMRWLPILFAQETLWAAVTTLAILAIHRRRRRNREIEKKWAEEDAEDSADGHP